MIRSLAFLLFLLTYPMVGFSQSVTIFGGSTIAQNCYQSSIIATQTGFTSHSDIEDCNKAIQHGALSKRDLEATYLNRGVIQVSLGNLDLAVKDYERVIRMNPEIAEAYLNRGNLWFHAQQFDEAISDYNKSLELNISKPQIAFLNRGLAKEYQGRLAEAKQDYILALDVSENWAIAQEKLDRVNSKL